MLDHNPKQAGGVVDTNAKLRRRCDTRRRGGQLRFPVGKTGRRQRVFQG
jgi:hypothetical protein